MDSGKRKIVAVGLVAILVVAAVAVVMFSGVLKGADPKATVLDASGTSVTLNQTPERIVSCSPAITEMVYSLGMGNKLVAVTKYCDYPAEAKAMVAANKTIGGFSNPSYEKILNCTPDMVLLEKGAPGHDDLARQLREAGVNVVVLYPQSNLETVYSCIDLLGNVTGKQTAAKGIIDEMKQTISTIGNMVGSANDSTDVMFVIYISEANLDSPYVAGGTTAIDQIITLAGGNNVFGDIAEFDVPSEEDLMDRASDVDYLFITSMFSDWNKQDLLNWLNSDSLWKNSPAVKNNSVYFLVGQAESIFNRQSVRMADAVQLMAQIIHPDAFDTVVPHADSGVNLLDDGYEDYLDRESVSSAAPMTAVKD